MSQQTEPRLQFAVFGIKTDGRSQNAAIIFTRQKPGHRTAGYNYSKILFYLNKLYLMFRFFTGGVVGFGVVETVT